VKNKKHTLNKNGIRVLPSSRRIDKIGQNLAETSALVREAAEHDAVISGGISE